MTQIDYDITTTNRTDYCPHVARSAFRALRPSSASIGVRVFLLLAIGIALSGCGVFGAEAESIDGPLSIRTPYPTFTPTSVAAQVVTAEPAPPTPSPVAIGGAEDRNAAEASPVDETSAVVDTGAIAVINSPLVNVRAGPGIEHNVVAMVERGAEYDIVGRNAEGTWWNICCVEGSTAWVIDDLVDTLGLVDSIPVSGGIGRASPAASTDTQPTGGQLTFELRKQEQFPESEFVRIFLYVYSGNQALAGYTLRVVKDGTELPVDAKSFGGQPAFTWPFQDARQRHQNFKVEFPDVAPAGNWEIQLIDSTGSAVGPSAIFTLAADDPLQELYVRYERP